MRLLLDTHTLIWWMADHPALSAKAAAAIEDPANDVHVSAVSAMEICTKVRLGKLPAAERLAFEFESACAAQGFLPLSITVRHGKRAGDLTHAHRDPFDRLLIAQALTDDLTLVSNDSLFEEFGVSRLW